MKKTFTSIMALLLSSALVCGFVSCKNNDDDSSSAPVSKTTPAVSTTGTVSAATTNASGQKTATLTASNGSYTFTETSSGANANIASRAAVDSTKGGEWTFTETNSSIPKYFGSFKGDISKLSSENVTLSLTAERTVLDHVALINLKDAKTFSLEATNSEFKATIPEVEAKKVTVTLPESKGTNPFNGKNFSEVILDGDASRKEKTWTFDGSIAKKTVTKKNDNSKENYTYTYAYDAEKQLLFLALNNFTVEYDEGHPYTISSSTEWENFTKQMAEKEGKTISESELAAQVGQTYNEFATRTVYQYSISENSITFTRYFNGSLPTDCNFNYNNYKLSMDMDGFWFRPNGSSVNAERYQCPAPTYEDGKFFGIVSYNKNYIGSFEATYTTEGKGTTGCSIKITFTKLPAGITDFTTGTEYTLTN